jgi:hypothetical protein
VILKTHRRPPSPLIPARLVDRDDHSNPDEDRNKKLGSFCGILRDAEAGSDLGWDSPISTRSKVRRLPGAKHLVWTIGKAFKSYLEVACGKSVFEKGRLVDLLHELPSVKCHIARDRLYSLRSIALGGESIKVDYDSSRQQVMLQSLEILKDSLCFCTCMQVVDGTGYSASMLLDQKGRPSGCCSLKV